MTILRILRKPSKSELLAEYAANPVLRYQQMDCFLDAQEDDLVKPDEDGDALFGAEVWKLRNNCAPVRIQIHDSVGHADAVRAVTKLLGWLRKGLPYDFSNGDASTTGSAGEKTCQHGQFHTLETGECSRHAPIRWPGEASHAAGLRGP